MPNYGGGYAMSPAAARKKAQASGNVDDDTKPPVVGTDYAVEQGTKNNDIDTVRTATGMRTALPYMKKKKFPQFKPAEPIGPLSEIGDK